MAQSVPSAPFRYATIARLSRAFPVDRAERERMKTLAVWHHVAPHHAVIAFSVKGALGDASVWEPVRAFPFGKSTFRHANGLTVYVVVSYHGGPTQILSNSTCVSKRLRRLDKKKSVQCFAFTNHSAFSILHGWKQISYSKKETTTSFLTMFLCLFTWLGWRRWCWPRSNR